VKRHPGEPESFTGLVQVLRFRGLLEESIGANSRAADLDPTVITSVAHTLFLLGDYAAAIEAYSGRAAYYLDAAAWAALGNQQRAKALLRERLAKMSLSKLMKGLMSSLLALLLGKRDEAVRQMETTDTTLEPEILIYFARHYTQMGLVDAAIKALRQAPQLGMVCAPMTLNKDAWLAALRKHNEFPRLLSVAEMQVAEARSTYERYVDGESPFPR
jgi:tetratricopeptide (TPR) repeat protein